MILTVGTLFCHELVARFALPGDSTLRAVFPSLCSKSGREAMSSGRWGRKYHVEEISYDMHGFVACRSSAESVCAASDENCESLKSHR